jgi:phosphoglucomutase
MKISTIPTKPIEGQKTGTSGLRKKVAFIESTPNYIENWIQSLLNALNGAQVGSSFVIGGDGRYLNDKAIVSAIEILAANKVKRVYIGQNGLLSTPAVSNIIRRRKLFGGIILTASHNPAGPHGDWGIKFNASNGEPAPEKLTDKIYSETLTISEIHRASISVDLSRIGETRISDIDDFVVEVIDPVDEYIELMREIFNFEKISKFLESKRIIFDGMHAVTGIYGKRIFIKELGLKENESISLSNCDPSPDFNGGHPDPNLVYAHDLVSKMMAPNCPFVLGAASDGDGDRNMIMGANWFVTPSDSLAIIADFAAKKAIPYFEKNGLKGVARSMPTSRAIDAVCGARNIPCFQTPTGWKYFGNLMDAGLVNLCGEESFGTGSDHIREKDGVWAVMSWLSILEFVNRGSTELIGVREINERHWDEYGRHMYCRCDYEEVDANGAQDMMNHVRSQLGVIVGTQIYSGWTVVSAEEYNYTDPVDKSEAKNQGFIVCFENGSRIVFRLSGTGSAGATIRVYMEYYVKEWRKPEFADMVIAKSPLMDIAIKLSEIERFSGRKTPSVIT